MSYWVDGYRIELEGDSLYEEFTDRNTLDERRQLLVGQWVGRERFFVQSVNDDLTKATLIDTVPGGKNDSRLRRQLRREGEPGEREYVTRNVEISHLRYQYCLFDKADVKAWVPDRMPIRFYINRWWLECGFELSYYGTGNVSKATYNGEHISNGRAKEVFCSKVWFDADGLIHVDYLSDRLPITEAEIIKALQPTVNATLGIDS